MSDDWKNDKPDRSNEMTFDQQIGELWGRDPFTPFTIVMNSGDRYMIEEPRSFVVGRDLIWLTPALEGFIFIRKNQIAGVEVAEPAS